MRFQDLDLAKLNSATRYPSIPTFHAMGGKGRLGSEHLELGPGPLFVSEKVDGTNTRVLVNERGESIVGSRNDLLAFSGDLLHNPAMGIVELMRPRLASLPLPEAGRVRVYFGESFGGRITAQSKQYSRSGATDFRLFDVLEFGVQELEAVLAMPGERISSWRERGGQPFLATSALESVGLPLTPRLQVEQAPPAWHREALDWLREVLPETRVRLDETGLGQPEGVIVRSEDRSRIAKLRFQDYRRTLR